MTVGRAESVALAALSLVYVFLSFLTYDHIEEDAFVYFRQAAQIADGQGYVWNRGGEPVEAASSALWLLLLVVLEHLSIDLVLGAKLAGCAIGVATLVLTYRLASAFVADPVLRLLPSALLAVSTPFVMNNQRGLETPLFALLVLCLCLCCIDKAWFRYWWVSAALLLPARPEGFFVLLALPPAFWLCGVAWRDVARGAIALAVVAATLLAVRFAYFHDLAPNPFYLKMRLEGWLGATRVHFLFFGNLIYVFSIPLLLTLRDRSFWNEGRRVLATFTFVQIVWTILAKDYMPYYRHMVPALPFIYVLVASGLDRFAAARAPAAGRLRRWLAVTAGATFVAATLWSSQSVGYFQRDFGNPLRTALVSFARGPARHVSAVVSKIRTPLAPTPLDRELSGTATIGNTYQCLVGEFLRRNYPEDIVVIYDQMGQTPFYAGLDKTFVDSWGLVDRAVARHSFEQYLAESGGVAFGLYVRALDGLRDALLTKEDRAALAAPDGVSGALDYLFGKRADLILINSFLTADAPDSLPALMRRDPRLERDYVLTFRLAGFVELFERRGASLRDGRLAIPRGLAVERP